MSSVLPVCLQNVDMVRPVQPQVHDLPPDPDIPTVLPLPEDPKYDPQPVPSDPLTPTVAQPAPFDPTAAPSAPSEPSIVVNSSNPLSSSSSESAEDLVNLNRRPVDTRISASSSEEAGGPVALRPPFSFRYQRRDRKKRQALMETSPTHNPVFLSDFPGGPSPFRSCPGPARFATV